MSAPLINENLIARDLLASLKSGAPIKGVVRSHSRHGATDLAWVAIDFPMLGERQVSVKDVPALRPGQTVVLHCVPNPAQPGHFLFHLAAAAEHAPAASPHRAPRRYVETPRLRRTQS